MEREPFLEMADVARLVGLSTDAVTAAVKRGELKPAAVTLRGLRLFTRSAAERYRDARAAERVKRERERAQRAAAA